MWNTSRIEGTALNLAVIVISAILWQQGRRRGMRTLGTLTRLLLVFLWKSLKWVFIGIVAIYAAGGIAGILLWGWRQFWV